MSKLVRYNSGHGSSDSGAVGTHNGETIYERDVAEDFVDDLVKYQKANYEGMTIKFGPEKPSGGDFPKYSNGDYNPSAYGTETGGYYSWHLNASGGSGHGTETWYWKTYGDGRARVVNDVLDNFFTDRDVKYADSNKDGYCDFYILRQCGFDTIVELAFIDNPNDMKILFTKWDAIVKAVGDAIAKHEGWKKKTTSGGNNMNYPNVYTEAVDTQSWYDKYDDDRQAWLYKNMKRDVPTYNIKTGKRSGTIPKGKNQMGYYWKDNSEGIRLVRFFSNGAWHYFEAEYKN